MPTEATFFLAGLFVIAAAAGWAFARYSDRDRDDPRPRISADYMRGLNLVLDRRTDEALELFVQIAKVDDDTLETHFALGHLFRRRGEVDRAIRVHQNLLARPNLSEPQRHQAIFALAEDFLSAGLFDRAEKLFSELAESATHGSAALEKLVGIYEREREWAKAIEAHRRLEVLSGEKSSRVAHFYCELAEQARKDGNLELARRHLKSSIRTESGALRGIWIRAAIAKEEQDYIQAVRLFEQVLETDRKLLAEILPELVDCYRRAGNDQELTRFLQKLIERDATVKQDIAYAAIIGNLLDIQALADCVQDFILHNEVLASLTDVDELAGLSNEQRDRTIRRIAGGLRQLAMSSARYRCTNCGYSTQRFIWHCPSCKEWESVRPIRTLQLEAMVT